MNLDDKILELIQLAGEIRSDVRAMKESLSELSHRVKSHDEWRRDAEVRLTKLEQAAQQSDRRTDRILKAVYSMLATVVGGIMLALLRIFSVI